MTSRHFQKKNNQKKTKKSSKKKSRFFGSRKQKKKENNNFMMKLSRKKTTKKRSLDGGGKGEKRKREDVVGESFVVSLQPSDYDEKKNNIVKFPYEIIEKSKYLLTAIESVEKKKDIGVISVPIDYNTLIKIQSILTRNLRSSGMNRPLDEYVDLLLATHYLDMKEFYDHIMNSILSEDQIQEIVFAPKYSDKLNQDIIDDILNMDRSSIETKYYYIRKKVPIDFSDTRKKLKVYICLNPLESVKNFPSLEKIQTKVNHIEFVTEENVNVLNERNINVIENPFFIKEPLSNILNNNTNIDYYIDHDNPIRDYNTISLQSVVFYGFRKKEYFPPRYTNCRGKISFRGMTSLEIVKNNWLRGANAREIDFTGLRNLKEVGDLWLSDNIALVNVDFRGLSNLKKVGTLWLENCTALVNVDFRGLSNLKEVGKHWLMRCRALETTNFRGLNNLEKVGDLWLSDCVSLTTVIFTDLNNLKEVGYGWLYGCEALTEVNFEGLSNLEKVDNRWLEGCTALTTANFTGLSNLKTVGDSWLFRCTALNTANFTGLSNLEKVGDHWLSSCRFLTTVILTDLNNLKEVGEYWLLRCRVLTTANFTGLNNLEKVGNGWLSDCVSLTTVIFTDLNNLKEVGDKWLSNCNSLNKSLIDFTPLTSLRQIGDNTDIRNIDDIRRIMVVG